jgi:hypothetical protein
MKGLPRLPDIAIKECIEELRAACRLPIEQSALDALVERLRPNFDRILGHPDGPSRWADHGQRMRDNGRYLGAFADFFGSRRGTAGTEALASAFQVVREACTVRVEDRPPVSDSEPQREDAAAPLLDPV